MTVEINHLHSINGHRSFLLPISLRITNHLKVVIPNASEVQSRFRATLRTTPGSQNSTNFTATVRAHQALRIHPIDKAALCSRAMRRMMLKTPAFGLKLKAIARITDRPAYRQSLSPQA